MDSLSVWMKSNLLKLNTKKTKLLVFNKDGLQPGVSVVIDDVELECVQNFKFLGVILDGGLLFTKHVMNLRAKLQKAGFVIRKLAKFVRVQELRTLYYAHIHSHLLYGLTVWGSLCPKSVFDSLYKTQKQLIRAVHKQRYFDHCMPSFKSMRVLTLSDQYHFDCLILMYRINEGTVPAPIVNMFRKSTHMHGTRNSNVHNVRHSSAIVNKSFLNRAPIMWQNCKIEYKMKTSVFSFKSVIRKQFIDKY